MLPKAVVIWSCPSNLCQTPRGLWWEEPILYVYAVSERLVKKPAALEKQLSGVTLKSQTAFVWSIARRGTAWELRDLGTVVMPVIITVMIPCAPFSWCRCNPLIWHQCGERASSTMAMARALRNTLPNAVENTAEAAQPGRTCYEWQ